MTFFNRPNTRSSKQWILNAQTWIMRAPFPPTDPMSHLNLYRVWPGERHENLVEMHNRHGGASVVWGQLFARYVDGQGENPELNFLRRPDELWPLAQRADIPQSFRRVLLMTFDDAYVLRANYAQAAADIRAFLAAFPRAARGVNHWPAIAAVFESQPDCPAIGFRWTSVCNNPFQGAWDEEAACFGAPDWSVFWDVYAEPSVDATVPEGEPLLSEGA